MRSQQPRRPGRLQQNGEKGGGQFTPVTSIARTARYLFTIKVENKKKKVLDSTVLEKGNFTFLVCDKPKKNDELIEVFDENTANEYSIYGDAFHKKMKFKIYNK